jgi:hypothetical protein
MQIAVIRLSAAPLVCSTDTRLFGGAEVRAFLFARGLAELTEHDVQLVVHAAEGPIPPSGRLSIQSLGHPGRAVPRRGPSGRLDPRRPRPVERAERLLRSLQRRLTGQPLIWPELAGLSADVLCTFGLYDPTASVVRTAQRSGKWSVVFLTSDLETEQALLPTAVNDHHRRWHRYALEQADLIVAQTRFQQSRVEQAGRPVVLVRNPIDIGLPSGAGIRPMTERKYILWVGRADTDCKRADLCLRLASMCPSVPFVAVMNPQDSLTHAQLPADTPANVRIVRRVDWQHTDRLYRDALALLNTSESEGFPNAFLQAAKYGVPILSRRVNPDQVLTNHGIGFVAHDDLSRLVKMIRQVHGAPERFSFVSRAARHYVERHHDLGLRIAELDGALAHLTQKDLGGLYRLDPGPLLPGNKVGEGRVRGPGVGGTCTASGTQDRH